MNRLVKLARERVSDQGQTHWVGCERDHRECLIQRMADEIEKLSAQVAHLLSANSGRPSAELYEAHTAELRAEAYAWELKNAHNVGLADKELSAVRAERDALLLKVRETLSKIARPDGDLCVDPDAAEMVDKIDAALGKEKSCQ